jgi:integrase
MNVRRSKKVGDRKTANEIAKKIAAKLVLGDFSLDEKPAPVIPTFREYVPFFDSGYMALNLKHTTIQSYRSVLKNHLMPVFGKMRLNEITRKDIKAFVINKQNSGLSPNTVRICRAYLSSILTQAVDDELISMNPAAGTGRYIRKGDTASKRIRPLTWEEKDQFEAAVKDHFPRYYPFFICALRTGMREGELIALKPSDISFSGGFIEVRRSSVRGRVSTPKSGKTRRVVMSEQLAQVLRDHLTQRKRAALKKGWGHAPEWLFYSREGKMFAIPNLRRRVFHKCLEKAGLRRIRLHDLRHSYATLRIQAGHNIADVSRQLGHQSIRITVDTYYHWMPGSGSREVNELDTDAAPKRTLSAPDGDIANQKEAFRSG